LTTISKDRQSGRKTQEVEKLSIFELDGKLFGLEILKSREVFPLPRFTPLPNCQNIYIGVFNLRGEIYPLVDVSPILGLPRKTIQPEDMVILVDDSAGFPLGILIDNIHGIVTYLPGDLKIARGVVSKSMENSVTGILHHQQDFIFTINLENIYNDHKLLAHS